MLVAVTASAIGFAYDAGSGAKELGLVSRGSYVVGCIFAVLAVRQAGMFTAVIQPPLMLFVAVPTAYFLIHGSQITGIKDILIDCGYPLIERFPLMFFTSAAVLLIGIARWYYGMSDATSRTPVHGKGNAPPAAGLTSKMSSLLTRRLRRGSTPTPPSLDAASTPSSGPAVRRKTIAAGTTRAGRPAKRADARRGRGTRARRTPKSSSPSPNIRAGPADRRHRPTEQPPEPRRRRARRRTRAARSVPPRRTAGTPAADRPRASQRPSAPSAAAASTITSRGNPTAPTETGPITRSRGCATAAVRTKPRIVTEYRTRGAPEATGKADSWESDI